MYTKNTYTVKHKLHKNIWILEKDVWQGSRSTRHGHLSAPQQGKWKQIREGMPMPPSLRGEGDAAARKLLDRRRWGTWRPPPDPQQAWGMVAASA